MGLGYVIARTGIWVDIWGVLAIIAFALVVIYFIIRRRKLIKMEEELEDLLTEKYERESGEASDESDEFEDEEETEEENAQEETEE